MATLTMKVSGATNVQRKMDKFLNRLGDFKRPVEESFRTARDDYRLQFQTQGGYFGSPWQKLAQRTQRERAVLGFNPTTPIHVRTGGLGESIFGFGKGHVEKVVTRPNGVTLTMLTVYTANPGSGFKTSSFQPFPTLNTLRKINDNTSPGFVPTITALKIVDVWRRWMINTSRAVF